MQRDAGEGETIGPTPVEPYDLDVSEDDGPVYEVALGATKKYQCLPDGVGRDYFL